MAKSSSKPSSAKKKLLDLGKPKKNVPSHIEMIATEAFGRMRGELAAKHIPEGATVYAFLFNQLKFYLGLAPRKIIPSFDSQPPKLSSTGEALDLIAKSTAFYIVQRCENNGVPPSSLPDIIDHMIPMYLDITNPPIKSVLSNAANKSQQPQSASPASDSSSLSSLLEELHKRQYSERLDRFVKELREFIEVAPKVFGPIPQAKKEYVEQLLAFIEEHQQKYKAGLVDYPFRFSKDEIYELENFCPAFGLAGLDWLEVYNKQN